MRQLFHTEFSKNKTIQTAFWYSLGLDLLFSQSAYHILILFALPYITSIGLEYFFNRNPQKKSLVRISRQFKSTTSLHPHRMRP